MAGEWRYRLVVPAAPFIPDDVYDTWGTTTTANISISSDHYWYEEPPIAGRSSFPSRESAESWRTGWEEIRRLRGYGRTGLARADRLEAILMRRMSPEDRERMRSPPMPSLSATARYDEYRQWLTDATSFSNTMTSTTAFSTTVTSPDRYREALHRFRDEERATYERSMNAILDQQLLKSFLSAAEKVEVMSKEPTGFWVGTGQRHKESYVAINLSGEASGRDIVYWATGGFIPAARVGLLLARYYSGDKARALIVRQKREEYFLAPKDLHPDPKQLDHDRMTHWHSRTGWEEGTKNLTGQAFTCVDGIWNVRTPTGLWDPIDPHGDSDA